MSIYYKPEVITYINDLVYVLYEKNYFGFLEDALNYKNKLIDFIEDNIATFPRKLTPLTLAHLGSHYVLYKSHRRTT